MLKKLDEEYDGVLRYIDFIEHLYIERLLEKDFALTRLQEVRFLVRDSLINDLAKKGILDYLSNVSLFIIRRGKPKECRR